METPYATQVLLLIVSLITILHFSACKAAGLNMTFNEKERNVLLSFKHGLSDPSNRLSTWSDEEDCCRWQGVRCDNVTGRVAEINLSTPLDSPYMELSGEISPSLLELKYLIRLDLSLNYFVHTQIPSFLGSMKGLRYLDLSLSEYLDLSGVDLHKEAYWLQVFSTVPSISELYLENCQINNLTPPKGKANFTYLKVLDISNNNLNQEIPSCGAHPDSLGHLKHLEVLDLSNNTITSPIPSSFANLSSLRTLNLGHNQLNGTIPKSLGFLINLQVLNLGSNSLIGGMPESLGVLSNLVTLDLSSNMLKGPIKESNLIKLSKLKELRLSSTNLFLRVNSSWVPRFQLEYILLSSCGIGPKFPAWLKMQSSLKALTMFTTGISDMAPSWF
ncbi:hypothetical protein RIF29_15105 [Crotalaria pallida]|uniref:Leucine-rich repeat-containing N-terminal plant-type domain-containing protein n=1 Tax=Crotalaria pallida TaxID=3830 RepID=A0AAN9FIE3_CROPI